MLDSMTPFMLPLLFLAWSLVSPQSVPLDARTYINHCHLYVIIYVIQAAGSRMLLESNQLNPSKIIPLFLTFMNEIMAQVLKLEIAEWNRWKDMFSDGFLSLNLFLFSLFSLSLLFENFEVSTSIPPAPVLPPEVATPFLCCPPC